MGRKARGGCCTVQLPWDSYINLCEREADRILNPQTFSHNCISEEDDWFCIPEWLYNLKNTNIKSCLDIGCGSGILALYCKKLFKCEVYCTDSADTNSVSTLSQNFNLNFKVNNIELDPFPWSEKFDVIIFTNVLEYLNFHPQPTLEKIRKLLSENGRLYLSTPDASEWGRITKYYNSLDEMPLKGESPIFSGEPVYCYDRDELLLLLASSGFKLEQIDYSKYSVPRQFYLELSSR